jgi:hypothetical protein
MGLLIETTASLVVVQPPRAARAVRLRNGFLNRDAGAA